MIKLKKIRCEFLTASEADSAIGKIKQYCGDIKIICAHDGYNYHFFDFDYDDYNYDYVPGNLNIWSFGGYGSFGNPVMDFDIFENRYARFAHNTRTRGRAILEIDVADDNYDYIKDK